MRPARAAGGARSEQCKRNVGPGWVACLVPWHVKRRGAVGGNEAKRVDKRSALLLLRGLLCARNCARHAPKSSLYRGGCSARRRCAAAGRERGHVGLARSAPLFHGHLVRRSSRFDGAGAHVGVFRRGARRGAQAVRQARLACGGGAAGSPRPGTQPRGGASRAAAPVVLCSALVRQRSSARGDSGAAADVVVLVRG